MNKEKNKDLLCENKQNNLVKAVGLGLALLILGSGVAYFLNLSDEAGDELKTNNTLGKALDNAGWMLYVQHGCGACGDQRVILGTAIRDIKVVDCGASREEGLQCVYQDIRVIPTWHNVFSNETRIGAQSIEQLEEMAK